MNNEYQSSFEIFATRVLDIMLRFAEENNYTVTYEVANQTKEIYQKGISPINDGLLYYIDAPQRKNLFYIRFVKEYNDFKLHAAFIDNSSISLTLDNELNRLTEYPSEDFNKRIDNVKGAFEEKLMKYLYMMWDFNYAFKILYLE